MDNDERSIAAAESISANTARKRIDSCEGTDAYYASSDAGAALDPVERADSPARIEANRRDAVRG